MVHVGFDLVTDDRVDCEQQGAADALAGVSVVLVVGVARTVGQLRGTGSACSRA